MELAVLVGIVLVGVGICEVVLGTYLLARPSNSKPGLVQLPESRADLVPPPLGRVGVPGADFVEIVGNTSLKSNGEDEMLHETKTPA